LKFAIEVSHLDNSAAERRRECCGTVAITLVASYSQSIDKP